MVIAPVAILMGGTVEEAREAGGGIPTDSNPPGGNIDGMGVWKKRGRQKTNVMAGGALDQYPDGPGPGSHIMGDVQRMYKGCTNPRQRGGYTNLRSCCTRITAVNQVLYYNLGKDCCCAMVLRVN
jgi:hypothetical protein